MKVLPADGDEHVELDRLDRATATVTQYGPGSSSESLRTAGQAAKTGIETTNVAKPRAARG